MVSGTFKPAARISSAWFSSTEDDTIAWTTPGSNCVPQNSINSSRTKQEGENDEKEASNAVVQIEKHHYDRDRTDKEIITQVRTRAAYNKFQYFPERHALHDRNSDGHCALIDDAESQAESDKLNALNRERRGDRCLWNTTKRLKHNPPRHRTKQILTDVEDRLNRFASANDG